MACTRRWSFGTRVPSPRPVVPSSPVRVAIWVSRFAMGATWMAVRVYSRSAARPCRGALPMAGSPRPRRRGLCLFPPARSAPRTPPTCARWPAPAAAGLLEALRARFGERCSTAQAVREQHGRDESPYRRAAARGGGVLREHRRRRRRGARWPAQHAVPVIPFGVGSSLEGHLLAVQGGVSVDLSRMNRHRARQRRGPDGHRAGRRDARAAQPRDPRHAACSSRSTPAPTPSLGGMAATRASGTNAVRYGTMRENVLGLTGGHRQRRGHPHRHARARSAAPATT